MTTPKRLKSTHSTETSATGLEERAYTPLADEADKVDRDANASNMHTRPEITDDAASFHRAHTTDLPSPDIAEQSSACTSFEVDQGCAKHKLHTDDNEPDWTRFLSMAQEKHDDNQRKMYMELSSGVKLPTVNDLSADLCSAGIDKKFDTHAVESSASSDDIEVKLPDHEKDWWTYALMREDEYDEAYYAFASDDEDYSESPSPPNGMLEVSSPDEQGQGLCHDCCEYGQPLYNPASEKNRTG